MFTQTQPHALPAPQAKRRIQNIPQECGPGYLTDLELELTLFHNSIKGQ